jgi:hypothetical protein
MPYSVGGKGTNGCSGYPVVKEGGEVVGCHSTRAEADAHLQALYANVSDAEKSAVAGASPSFTVDPKYPGAGIKRPQQGVVGNNTTGGNVKSSYAPRPKKNSKGRHSYSSDPAAAGTVQSGGGGGSMGSKSMNTYSIKEGDYVQGKTTEGMVVGQVEHVMLEGGVYGTPGTEYSIQSTPENPAMAVRVFEEEDGMWYATAYSIGMLYSDATKVENLPVGQDDDSLEELELLAKQSPCWEGYTQRGMKPGSNGKMVPNCIPVKKYYDALEKADTYTPTAGMKSAARRALKWKEQGKATGAGTPVGWGRASDIVAGRSMSISVVRRMYSFFSRHEVDKKGKDFYNTSNPSNGRIMWDAWGGDAGFSWSRSIVEREKVKKLWDGSPFQA